MGKKWSAQDVGTPERACSWMKNGFMSVNTTLGAGQAFLRSLYQQYYDWGVDFGILRFSFTFIDRLFVILFMASTWAVS